MVGVRPPHTGSTFTPSTTFSPVGEGVKVETVWVRVVVEVVVVASWRKRGPRGSGEDRGG